MVALEEAIPAKLTSFSQLSQYDGFKLMDRMSNGKNANQTLNEFYYLNFSSETLRRRFFQKKTLQIKNWLSELSSVSFFGMLMSKFPFPACTDHQ